MMIPITTMTPSALKKRWSFDHSAGVLPIWSTREASRDYAEALRFKSLAAEAEMELTGLERSQL